MRASANGTWQPAQNITRLGNITRASNGRLEFPSLQVFGTPGDYLLQFAPLDPNNRVLQPANLSLTLRTCVTGEAGVDVNARSDADKPWRDAGVNFRCAGVDCTSVHACFGRRRSAA
jgi:hypothetical protein